MYTKDLKSSLRIRLSDDDMEYLQQLAGRWNMNVSQVLRCVIGDLRRKDSTSRSDKEGGTDGNSQTYIYD